MTSMKRLGSFGSVAVLFPRKTIHLAACCLRRSISLFSKQHRKNFREGTEHMLYLARMERSSWFNTMTIDHALFEKATIASTSEILALVVVPRDVVNPRE